MQERLRHPQGLILAALFAATMSTRKFKSSYWVSKFATLGATIVALVVALADVGNVFTLVVLAWAALGAGLGPLMMVGAAPYLLVWKFVLGWSGALYEGLPGFVAGLMVFAWGEAVSERAVGPSWEFQRRVKPMETSCTTGETRSSVVSRITRYCI